MTILKARIGGEFVSVLAGYASNVYVGPEPPLDPNVEFWVDTDEVLPVVPWISFTPLAPWTNLGGTWGTLGYRKVGDVVEMRGLLDIQVNPAVNNNIFVLPVGYRPSQALLFPGMGAGGSRRLDLLANGTLMYSDSLTTLTYMSLSTIRFSVTP